MKMKKIDTAGKCAACWKGWKCSTPRGRTSRTASWTNAVIDEVNRRRLCSVIANVPITKDSFSNNTTADIFSPRITYGRNSFVISIPKSDHPTRTRRETGESWPREWSTRGRPPPPPFMTPQSKSPMIRRKVRRRRKDRKLKSLFILGWVFFIPMKWISVRLSIYVTSARSIFVFAQAAKLSFHRAISFRIWPKWASTSLRWFPLFRLKLHTLYMKRGTEWKTLFLSLSRSLPHKFYALLSMNTLSWYLGDMSRVTVSSAFYNEVGKSEE